MQISVVFYPLNYLISKLPNLQIITTFAPKLANRQIDKSANRQIISIMKHFLVSLLAIAALAACSKNDDDTNGNNGGGNTGGGTVTSTTQTPTVKKVTETIFKKGVEHTSVTTFHYENEKVMSLRSIHLVGGVQTGTTFIIELKYDANGRIIERINRNEDGSIDRDSKIEKFSYDSNGFLKHKEITYLGNWFVNKKEISYSYEGNKVKTTTSIEDTRAISSGIEVKYKHYEIQTFDFTAISITVSQTSYNIYSNENEKKEVSTEKTVYTLSGGNVTKIEKTTNSWGTSTTLIEYDNTPKLESFLPIYFVNPEDYRAIDFSKNNPTKQETTQVYKDNFDNSTKTSKGTTIYKYEYNSAGTYPIKREEYYKEEGEADILGEIISVEY